MVRSLPALLALLAAASPALAAPQILGLVATGERPVPMQCSGDTCTAMLSAFCLQQQRLPPDHETAYVPAEGTSLTLILTGPDGSTSRIAAGALLDLRSRYGFTAVRADLSLPVQALSARSVALEVGPRAALLPVARAGDPDPLKPAEIAEATGPLRSAAEAILEGESERARSVQLSGLLINALPMHGDVDAAERKRLWHALAGPDAPDLVRRNFEACNRTVDQSVGYRLRKCLEERHERLQIDNTHAYWASLSGW